MVERLSAEDRDHLIDCKSCRHGVKWHHDGSQQGCQYFGVGPGRCACPLTHDEAAATHVAAAVAEERERIATAMPEPRVTVEYGVERAWGVEWRASVGMTHHYEYTSESVWALSDGHPVWQRTRTSWPDVLGEPELATRGKP